MRVTLTAALVSLLLGCGGEGPGSNTNANQPGCPEGHRAEGPACVPVFDDPADCPATNEMPVLGGGCRAVGVTRCATGFVSDGEGGCDAILPPEDCPPGTIERIGETECQPVGVTQCATGFLSDGEGGCDAILPPEDCPPGTLEVLGLDACQPLGDCGPEGSRWGLIDLDGTTVYVDATAEATGATGTATAPFPTLGAALAVVEPGGQVAIAAGEYVGALELPGPVRLTGRCASLVVLRSPGPGPSLKVPVQATGSEIRGVTLTGNGEGLRVTGAGGVIVEQVEVRDTGGAGVVLFSEAEATLRRVRITGSTKIGLAAHDSQIRASEVAVRGTRSDPDTGGFGWGVAVEISGPGEPGGLVLTSSVLDGNREAGVLSLGASATIVGTAIRDTLPSEGTASLGTALLAQCDHGVGGCGRLRVEGSVFEASRAIGVLLNGVDATVRSSVVRDTLPSALDGSVGRGINAECWSGVCGSLLVESSLIRGNRDVGLCTFGTEATIRASVVRDTLSQQSDLTNGRGIEAGCDPDVGICGNLRIEGTLLTGNREAGLRTSGLDVTLRDSVVRDTLPSELDRSSGRGIDAQCDPDVGTCGTLLVEGSLVTGNRHIGIDVFGLDTTVRASVLRDTQPQLSDRSSGRGLEAQCDVALGVCGTVLVEGSVVTGNHDVGIIVGGPDLQVVSTVVRDTQPDDRDQRSGRGIDAECYQGFCGTLVVAESLVASNHDVGISTFGVEAAVRDTIIRDTLPQNDEMGIGRGIIAQCDSTLRVCGALLVDGSLIQRSEDTGIFIAGVPTELTGVAVVDTSTNASGVWAGLHGQGIWAICDEDFGACSTLSMIACLVRSSVGAGVALDGVSGYLTSSSVRTVVAQPRDGTFGYGIQISGHADAALPVFHVRESSIEASRLAGVFYYRSQGTLSGSSVTGSEYCVAMNEGSLPTVTEDNQLSCSVRSEPEWVSLLPAPAPPPTTPLLPASGGRE